ncbi:hypothetical protein GWK41_05195 [Persephonella atlantica]|uniref:Flagellar FliJ protein n=1 Tax=Persephonella atlantica TaxID=2699429 RepID=A0ABS1GHV2_9AQUI|nr:hypothetical protein [Persephonella atlantica]MBK3332456.1 hypothetical protein [Persephonella atlantica]
MDILEAFIKKLKSEINKERQVLKAIEEEIYSLAVKKNRLTQEYKELEKLKLSDSLSLHMKTIRMLSILKSIKSIEEEIKQKEEEAEKLRIKIKEKNAEKKAIKNYQEKLKKEKNVKELKVETQLADESFNRNH